MTKAGDVIFRKLEELDITQVEFAKRMNISRISLNGYLHNERQIPFDLLVKISQELEISLDNIYHLQPKADDRMMSEREYEIIREYRKLSDDKREHAHEAFMKILKITNQT